MRKVEEIILHVLRFDNSILIVIEKRSGTIFSTSKRITMIIYLFNFQ